MVDFANISSDKVLLVYKELAGCELIESSDAKKQYHRSISIRQGGSKEEVLKAIEKAMVEQTGIVLTRLDAKRVSITFNDALSPSPVVRENPKNVILR